MQYVDTHCHLDFPSYEHDIEEVILRAVDQGVNRIVVPGLQLESSRSAIRLAERFDEVYAAIGVHPGDVESYHPDQYSEFVALITHEKVVAVGEIGLDYYHRQDNIPLQKKVLDVFLDLAFFYKKPVILHSRNCLKDLVGIVQQKMTGKPDYLLQGVFHAYEGNLAEALIISEMGFYLGAGGPVTYKNAAIKQEVFSKIELSRILLETDGPFLAPQEHRGRRNEPAWIPIIAQKIAELRQCDIKELASVTTGNAQKLFNWT